MRWQYTLKSGKKIRSAIQDGDIPGVLDGLEEAYAEISRAFSKSFTEDDLDDELYEIADVRDTFKHYREYDFSYNDVEDSVDGLLDRLYDLCDELGIWVAI